MSAENAALAHRFHGEIFSEDRLEVVDEIVAPDFAWHSPGLPLELANRDGVKQFASMLRAAFPDYTLTNDDTIAAGDKVVTRWTHRGRQEGDFMGIAATGKEVTISGIDIFRVADGKIAELWQLWDQLGMLRQLGVVPETLPA